MGDKKKRKKIRLKVVRLYSYNPPPNGEERPTKPTPPPPPKKK